MLSSCISWIKGVVRSQNEYNLEIQIQNVAYTVMIASGRFSHVKKGSEIELEIISEWHDDGLKLYGFIDIESKKAFSLLRSISGVGGRTALNILGLFTVPEFHQIILNKNSDKLKRAPKIGARLSQRIISELQDRIEVKLECDLTLTEQTLTEQTRATMLTLGYGESDIDKTITILLKHDECSKWSIQTWIKMAMNHLSADIITKSSKITI